MSRVRTLHVLSTNLPLNVAHVLAGTETWQVERLNTLFNISYSTAAGLDSA